MALTIKGKKPQEIIEKTNEFECCTAEVFREKRKTFQNRVLSANKNQEFLRHVIMETRESNYCELRKIEMHYLNELSQGIKYFIKTLDEEHKEIADIFRMYYGHIEEKEPMTLEEISDEMNIPVEKIEEIMRLGYRILCHPSKRYLFLNHNQLRNYYNFHDEIFEMISKKDTVLDEIDQYGELNVEFNFKEHRGYSYDEDDAYNFYCKIEADRSTDSKEDLRDFEDTDK